MPRPPPPLILLICLAAAGRAQATDLLVHADLDGQLAPAACIPADGRARAADLALTAGLIAEARPTRSAALALLGGNIAAPGLFGRSLLSDDERGADALAGLLARAGYDALTFGHHDLSLPPADRDRLVAAIGRAGLPLVLSNLSCAARGSGLCATAVAQVVLGIGGERIGVVAALSPLVLPGIAPASRAGWTLMPAVPALARATAQLRAAGVDRVVALVQGPRTGAWLPELVSWQRQLATAPARERPDVLLAGGLATPGQASLRRIEAERGPIIVVAAEGVAAITRVAWPSGVSPGTNMDIDMDVRVLAAGPRTAPDPAIAERLGPALRRYCDRYGAAISGPGGPVRLRRPLDREDFLRYVLAVMRRSTGAEIALLNRDFIKQAAFPLDGVITRADLLHAMPYADPAGRARLTGAVVASALAPALDNPRLAALGLERRPDGSLLVNGRPLDRARHYTVTSNLFLASGGDEILATDVLPLRLGPGAPELRALVERQLSGQAGAEDGDPTVDPDTDFGPPASARPLLVGLADLALDLSSVAVSPQPGYESPQLTRAEQRALKADLALVGQLRTFRHEADGRVKLLYGLTRTQAAGAPAATGETADLLLGSMLYNFRGLRRDPRGPPAALVPDPYARLQLESELTVPEATTPEARRYRHAELTATVGALFTPRPVLRLRGGPGLRQQLLADGEAGRVRFLVEAGATLDPIALVSFGPLQARLEGMVDYSLVEPTGVAEHQLRGASKLAFPLLPLLYLTAGVDLYAMKRRAAGWGLATDATLGLRLHLDGAHQRL